MNSSGLELRIALFLAISKRAGTAEATQWKLVHVASHYWDVIFITCRNCVLVRILVSTTKFQPFNALLSRCSCKHEVLKEFSLLLLSLKESLQYYACYICHRFKRGFHLFVSSSRTVGGYATWSWLGAEARWLRSTGWCLFSRSWSIGIWMNAALAFAAFLPISAKELPITPIILR